MSAITVTPGPVTASLVSDPPALDVSVEIEIGDTYLTGDVTLLPAEDGTGYTSWGEPAHWVESDLLRAIYALPEDDYSHREVLMFLAGEAGAAADKAEVSS